MYVYERNYAAENRENLKESFKERYRKNIKVKISSESYYLNMYMCKTWLNVGFFVFDFCLFLCEWLRPVWSSLVHIHTTYMSWVVQHE